MCLKVTLKVFLLSLTTLCTNARIIDYQYFNGLYNTVFTDRNTGCCISAFLYIAQVTDFGIDYTQLYAFTDSDYQCQIDATIEYWDSETYLSWVYDSTELAWVNGFDSNHGTFSVVTTDRSKYGIETEWNMRVTLNLPDSLMDDDEVTITDQFTVYLKDACADNELSIDDAN